MSRWTDEEVFLLKEHFPTTPKNYMSEEILADRTAEAISRKLGDWILLKKITFILNGKSSNKLNLIETRN